jgi:uncharacterized protein (TIGR02444 family)
MTAMTHDNVFWRFSLAVYAAPGVQAECLALQDMHDVDVNLLLFCAWAGAHKRRRLAPADLDRLSGAGHAWRESVVKPLRSARRAIKTLALEDPAALELRRRIAADELEAERLAQAMLFSLAPENGGVEADAETDTASLVQANIALLLGGRTAALPEALIAAAVRGAGIGAADVAAGEPRRENS